MSRLVIRLFGTFEATLDGRLVEFPTDRSRALLAYLAVESNRPHRRESLCGLFWPDHPEAAARVNLRQALHRLRGALGEADNPAPHLLVSFHDIQLDPRGNLWLDVANFEGCFQIYRAHCGSGLPLCSSCLEALKGAISLVQGEFMAGLSVPGSLPFDLWRLDKQEHYHRQVLEGLGRLGSFHEQTRDFARAAEVARRLIRLEPWRESYHRLLMRNLAQGGQRQSALDQYERCRQMLVDEMGVEPLPATTKLFESIRDGHLAAVWRDDPI